MRAKLLAVVAGVAAAMLGPAMASGSVAMGAEAARTQQVVPTASTVSTGVTTWAVQWGRPDDIPVPADYIGDSRTDIAVWRPSTGEWWIRGMAPVVWGLGRGDRPVPADYDGDGKAEIAIFRDGTWFVRGVGTFVWGQSYDLPVPENYVGDGRADLAVVRTETEKPLVWYVRNALPVAWGRADAGLLVPADYLGDSRTDIAVARVVWRGEPILWFVRGAVVVEWGRRTPPFWLDQPVLGNFIGDAKTDIAVWRLSGEWFIRGLDRSIRWGDPSEVDYRPVDRAAVGDYGGDSHTDIAVWREATGTWYIRVESPLR